MIRAAGHRLLDRAVVPLFYRDPAGFTQMMLHCISLNGSFFNTHRMVQEYVTKTYLA